MSQLNQKPIGLTATKPPGQQVQGVSQNGSQQEKAKEAEAVRQIVCTKKVGDKWEIKFLGPVGRRDINRIIVTIRVAFARQKRKQRMGKIMQERKLADGAAQLEQNDNGKS